MRIFRTGSGCCFPVMKSEPLLIKVGQASAMAHYSKLPRTPLLMPSSLPIRVSDTSKIERTLE